MERACRQLVVAIEGRFSGARKIVPADLGDLQSAARGQQEITESLTRRTDGPPARLRALLGELAESGVAEAGLAEPLAAVAQGIDRLGQEVLPPLAGNLRTAVKTAQIDLEEPAARGTPARSASDGEPVGDGPGQVSASLRRAVGGQDRVIETFEQWLAVLNQADQFGRLRRDLERLRRQQDAVADRTRAIGRRTLTFELRDLPPEAVAELTAAADRQRELSEGFDRLLEPMASLNDALRDEARRLAVGDQMRRTAEEIRQNRIGQASVGQRQIAAALRALAEMLAARTAETADSPSTGPSSQPGGDSRTSRNRQSESPPAATGGQSGNKAAQGGGSAAPNGQSVATEDIRSLLNRFWGQLPPAQRAGVQQWAVEDFPPEFRSLIEAYYRRLAEGRDWGLGIRD
jgi:hypothetical protein